MKGQTDTSKFTGTKPDTPATDPNNNNFQNYNPVSDDKKSSTAAPLLSSEGAVGKQFKADGGMCSDSHLLPRSLLVTPQWRAALVSLETFVEEILEQFQS